MPWDEWEQIKATVAEQGSTGMQLNQTQGAGGGLKSSKQAWVAAGDGVGSLRTSVSAALAKLETGQSGLGDPAGCLSAAAQREVYASWKAYVQGVGKRCADVQKIMEQVGHEQLTTDEAVEAAFGGVRAARADTDTLGGR